MPGPDQKLSLDPKELTELVNGCNAVKQALGSTKKILKNEKPVLQFARESVVTISQIKKNEIFSEKNISTKRPATGEIPAKNFFNIIGKKAKHQIPNNTQLTKFDIK